MSDVFPVTQRSWILERIADGRQGRRDVNRHVMEVYYRPLQAYVRGHGLRWLGTAEELVAKFFADRLARPGFFDGWRARDMRLRRWLMNAMNFFLHEEAERRQRSKERNVAGDLAESPTFAEHPERLVERAYAEAVVERTRQRTRQLCEAKNLGAHYRVLTGHYLDRKPYAVLAAEFDINEGRARWMARTARKKYRVAMREILKRDGVPDDEIDAEIEGLLDALRS